MPDPQSTNTSGRASIVGIGSIFEDEDGRTVVKDWIFETWDCDPVPVLHSADSDGEPLLLGWSVPDLYAIVEIELAIGAL